MARGTYRGSVVIGGGPWAVWVLGFIGLTSVLALVEFAALFVRLASRAAAGQEVDR